MSSLWPARTRLAAVVLLALLLLVDTACSSGSGSAPPPSGSASGTTSATGAPASKPNILILETDDMSAAEMKYMPRTRRLIGRTGVTFTDFTAPQPLCCPSRAQLLTGQYAQNNGVKTNSGPEGGYAQFHPDTALPVWLQNAGYQTAMIGKYLNGYPADHPKEVGWDRWNPTVRHIYDYFGFTQYDDGAMTRPPGYHTDYVADQSEQLVTDLAADDRPFFLWTSFIAPHSVCKVEDEQSNCFHPPRPGPRDKGRFDGMPGLTDSYPSFNEKDNSDKPPFLAHHRMRSVARLDRLSDRRAEALTDVDRSVAGIMKALAATGELDNTLVLFTSDNGYLIGQHRYVGKTLVYSEAVKVPLLMTGLGLPAGVKDDRTYAMIDLAPTFAALAGATPLVTMDGIPIVVRSKGRTDPPDRSLLVQAGVGNLQKNPSGWLFRGVRTRRYTWVAWDDGFRELYDRKRDPYELQNVAGERRYAYIVKLMEHRLDILGPCAGDSCRTHFSDVPEPGQDLDKVS